MTSLRIEIMDKIVALMTAAFGFIAALAWNGAISQLIEDWLGTAEDSTLGLLIYAVIVTIVAVVAIVLISRAYGKMKALEERKEERK
jgi:hypothetical protein